MSQNQGRCYQIPLRPLAPLKGQSTHFKQGIRCYTESNSSQEHNEGIMDVQGCGASGWVLPAMFVPRDPPPASADWAVVGHLIPLEKTHSGSLLGIWSRARCQVVSAGWHTEDVNTLCL